MPASPRYRAVPDRVPLPAEGRAALKRIADDLRHMPTECIYDRAELVHWLSRMARRIDAERDRTTPAALPAARPAQMAVPRALSARERADAVFKGPVQPTPMPPKPRSITSRKGRSVRVEVRRVRAAGQMEMPL